MMAPKKTGKGKKGEGKGKSTMSEVVTREYTINMHKRIHGVVSTFLNESAVSSTPNSSKCKKRNVLPVDENDNPSSDEQTPLSKSKRMKMAIGDIGSAIAVQIEKSRQPKNRYHGIGTIVTDALANFDSINEEYAELASEQLIQVVNTLKAYARLLKRHGKVFMPRFQLADTDDLTQVVVSESLIEMDFDSDEEKIFENCLIQAGSVLVAESISQRSCSVSNDNIDRSKNGEFVRTVMVRRQNGTLYEYLRLTNEQFDCLLSKVRSVITKSRTASCPISAEERLAVTLRCLSHGISFTELAHSYHMGKCTVSKIVNETSKAIFDVLKNESLKFPNKDGLKIVSSRFWDRWKFPNCFGAVDGKHIILKAPDNAGSIYFNYKGTHSLVLMALVDADYNFLCVKIGDPGSECDATVFDSWDFVQSMEQGQIALPADMQLPYTTNGILCPMTIIGDGGFPARKWLLKPFADNGNLTDEKKIFNYRLSHARIVSENAFGILTQRWLVLRKMMEFSPTTAINVTLCCVALHNWLRKTVPNGPYSPATYCDNITSEGIIHPGSWRQEVNETENERAFSQFRHSQTRSSAAAQNHRNNYLQYFQNEGSTLWQNRALTIGTCHF